MSITVTTADKPAANPTRTVTANIEVTRDGTAYLRVRVDGDLIAFKIDPNTLQLRLHEKTVPAEAKRLLQRHAGYEPTTKWTTGADGHMSATVAEMTGRCATCVHGCGCELGSTGCGHYQCPAASADIVHTCDGAALALNARRTYPKARRRCW